MTNQSKDSKLFARISKLQAELREKRRELDALLKRATVDPNVSGVRSDGTPIEPYGAHNGPVGDP